MPCESGELAQDQVVLGRLVQDRRHLHRIPELGLELPETVAYVTDALEPLGCAIVTPISSCVCAFFDFDAPSTLAFRADMDALPVAERTGLPFASEHAGCMHACGHDGHTSILLELARQLALLRDAGEHLPNNVLLVFQPGEEHPGGARLVCESGIFQQLDVGAIFGLHLWPGLAEGVVATRPGAFLAQASELDLHVHGRGAHAAHRDEGADALVAAARIALGCREVEAAEKGRGEACVVNVGRLEAGTVRNAVAAEATLEGTVRTFSRESFERVSTAIRGLASAEEAARAGITCDVSFNEGYPAVVNDERLACLVLDSPLGVELVANPEMIAEDFSFYQQAMPGCFLFLGTGRPECGLHAPTFDFDERILARGVELFRGIAAMGVMA